MTKGSPQMMLLVGLFAWGIYRRIRRNIGRQKLRPRRIIVSLVLLGLVSMLVLSAGVQTPMVTLGYAGGMLCGVALAFLGLRHTKFETAEDGHYYTPNTYIGLALSLLLMGRVIYRLFLIQDNLDQSGNPQALQTPLTMLIVGLTVGYYLAYYIGLFVHTHDKNPAGLTS